MTGIEEKVVQSAVDAYFIFVAPCAVDGDGQVGEVRAACCESVNYWRGEDDEGVAVIGIFFSGWFQGQVAKVLTMVIHKDIESTRADITCDL